MQWAKMFFLAAIVVVYNLLFSPSSVFSKDLINHHLFGNPIPTQQILRESFGLSTFLSSLSNDIVLKEESFYVDGGCSSPGVCGNIVTIIPLVDKSNPEKAMYAYSVQNHKVYYVLEMLKDEKGNEVVILSDSLGGQLVISNDLTEMSGVNSFTTDGVVTNGAVSDTLACLANVLGFNFSFDNLKNVLSSVACSALDTFGTVQTVLNCLSVAGVGANLAFATLGCVTGTAKLIACGVFNCTGSGVDLDQQAIRDMENRARRDNRFGDSIPDTFDSDLNWHPEWELRWMYFNFTNGRTTWIAHATRKSDSSNRWTRFSDPDSGSVTPWERVP